jgi:hypothetical protein
MAAYAFVMQLTIAVSNHQLALGLLRYKYHDKQKEADLQNRS